MVNQNNFRNLQINLSGMSVWLILFGAIWLLGTIGLGWLVKSVLVLIGLIIITPVIAFFGLQWWLSRNLVEAECPVCTYPSTGINGMQLRCPSCGESLKVEKGKFLRLTPPGTVDVDAVEVVAKQIED